MRAMAMNFLQGMAVPVAVLATLAVWPTNGRTQQVDPGLFSGMRWRSVGPYRAGRISAITGIPGDYKVMYAGTPGGGVWKSVDGGEVWAPIFDEARVASIGAIAVAASNHNIIYVGTGEQTPGNGIYRSADAGKTWQHIGLEDSLFINSILVDPRDPNVVLVGVSGGAGAAAAAPAPNPARGIYRTTDGGQTWKHVLFKDALTGVTDMSRDLARPEIVFATFPKVAGVTGGGGPYVYQSGDEGMTWTEIHATGLPAAATRYGIAVASGMQDRRIYIDVAAPAPEGGVFRSEDGGKTWVRAGSDPRLEAGAFGRIYADPKNSNRIYVMGTSMYRSEDAGHTFAAIAGAPSGDDMRLLWIDSDRTDHLAIGVDQGVTISIDDGDTWSSWYNLANGQFYHISADNEVPYRLYAAQQDSGTVSVLSRSDFGEIRPNDWYPVGGFEAGYIVTDPLNSRWVYAQGWYHTLVRFDRITSQAATVFIPGPKDQFAGSPPMVFSPQDGHVLYMGAQYVLRTSNGGQTWDKISPDLTAHPVGGPSESTDALAPHPTRARPPAINTIAASTLNAGELWAGASDGTLFVTRDDGKNWKDVTPPGLTTQSLVSIVEASHHNAGTAYAAVDVTGDRKPYIYRTRDYGQTWQPIMSGLPPNAPVRVVRDDPTQAGLLFAGTEGAAWISFDDGDHWQTLQLNLPTTTITDMVVHGDDLDISTYGRSIWILDDVTPLRQVEADRSSVSAANAFLFQPQQAWRMRWAEILDTPLPRETPTGENPPDGAILDYYLKSKPAGPIKLEILDGSGTVVRTFTSVAPPKETMLPNVPAYWVKPPDVLDAAPGMHRFAWDERLATPKVLPYAYAGGLLGYFEYTLNWYAIPGHTPSVVPMGPLDVPGQYHARLTVDGKAYERDFTVKNDPRSVASAEDIAAEVALQQHAIAGQAETYDVFTALEQARKTLAAEVAKTDSGNELSTAARDFDQKLKALSLGDTSSASNGFGLANRDLSRILLDLEYADQRPTESTIASVQTACGEIDAARKGLNDLRTSALPALNAQLTSLHLAPLNLPVTATTPACGF